MSTQQQAIAQQACNLHEIRAVLAQITGDIDPVLDDVRTLCAGLWRIEK